MTRTMRERVIAGIIVASILLTGGWFAANAQDLRRIVVFQDGTPAQVQQQVVVQSGSRLLRLLPLVNGASVELPALGTAAALAYLTAHPAVAQVSDDPRIGAHGVEAIAQGAGGDGAGGDGAGGDQVLFVTPTAGPSTEIYPWGIDRIGAADLQEDRPGVAGDGVKVAVFDTGLDRNHPELAQNIVGGFNAIADADPSAYDDDNGHGTAMAGIIAARHNRVGVVGAAPRAVLYAVKVLDRNGRGHTSDGIFALGEIMNRQDIRIINMSYGTSLVWPLFEVAIRRVSQSGKIVVTSRGNRCSGSAATAQGAGGDGAGGDGAGGDGAGGDGAGGDGAGGDAACGPFAVRYPAAYPEVIAVGATTAGDDVAGYSLWGGVDVVAPGGDSTRPILTLNRGGGYGTIIGTSPAAAHVSGAVALALALDPTLSLRQVTNLLQSTADRLQGFSEDQQGAGLIDVEAMAHELGR